MAKNKNMKMSHSPALRQMWFVLGLTCTGLGIAGYILPVMPGTTFILIALFCFARSNETWYNKLINNKHFGHIIKDYQEGRGMSLKAKINAVLLIMASISVSLYFASNTYVQVFLVACCAAAVTAVLRQKTKK
jgi:uncharacterized protein